MYTLISNITGWPGSQSRVRSRMRFLVLLFVLVSAVSARGQSVTALQGMEAHNRGDIATAYLLLQRAASAGDPEAQVNLGYLYARGQGVTQDQAAALRLYQAAAAQGDSEGMNAVGYKYEFGTGVQPDIQWAIHWYCRAVVLGNPRALNNLGRVVFNGKGLPKDVFEARRLWQQAAKLGKSNAMFNLGLSYLDVPEDMRDRPLAETWLGRAAAQGQPSAQKWLRDHGYKGPLPPAANEAALMIPAPTGASGHSKVCGELIS